MRSTIRLASRRLVFVTGKGGVGKTTVAAAIALAAAARGLRVLACEVTDDGDLGAALGGDPLVGEERQLAGTLWGMRVDPRRARDEWLHYRLPAPLAVLVAKSRIVDHLGALAPGFEELLAVGKVWEVAQERRISEGGQPYDVVVCDAPASGHGLAMLGAPAAFREAAAVGPVRRHASRIEAFLSDPRATAIVCVANPEELAVTEALETDARLRRELGRGVDLAVVNGALRTHLRSEDARRLEALHERLPRSAQAAATVALAEHRRAADQRRQIARLRRAGLAVCSLPLLATDGAATDGAATDGTPLAALLRPRISRLL